MLTGFKNFLSSAWNAVAGFFSGLGSWFKGIISGAKAERQGDDVHWTFPDYQALAEQMHQAASADQEEQPVQEVTTKGDKGRMIAKQIKDYGLVKKPMSPNQTKELEDNVSKVASWLGYAFEIGVVLYLCQHKNLKLVGNWTVQRLQDKFNVYVGRVRDNYELSTRSTTAREKFIELLYHNIGIMAEDIHDKSIAMLPNCENLETVEYIGMDQYSSQRSPSVANSNIGGSDLIVSCKESGEMSFWSTKYMSNPHSSIAKKSPADIHRLFGGRGNRSDEYYHRINVTNTPQNRANKVLYDLWESLKNGFAVDRTKPQSDQKLILKGDWAVSIFQSLLRGDVKSNPAWMNYARGNRAVGDYQGAFNRDFDLSKRTGELRAKPEAYAEATLEGYNIGRMMSLKPGDKPPKPAIKIKLVTPGQAGMRRTYLKFYVNDAPPDDDRYSKYQVQVQMNNLTTE